MDRKVKLLSKVHFAPAENLVSAWDELESLVYIKA